MSIDNRYQGQSSSGLKYGIIEVTTLCQFRCPGCYMVVQCHLNRGDMTLAQAINVLDLCCNFCGHELETMDILGGEPLLWPHLEMYIEELLRRGILPWVFTNMSAITPERAKWLFERNVHITGKLNIADPTDTKQIVLQAEMIGATVTAARKMCSAIDVFRNAGYRDPLFRLQNLIRKANIRLVPDFIRFCRSRELGVDLELMGSGEAVGPRYWEVAPTPQELANMIRELERQGCAYRESYATSNDGVYPEYDQPIGKLLMPHVFGSCPFYDKGLHFAADGTIRACSNSTRTLAKASDPDPIRAAWESPLLSCRRSLTQATVGEPCRSCDRWNKCRGGCRATVEGMGDPCGGYLLCPLPILR